MFGGYGKFGNSAAVKKILTDLPSHDRVRITGKLHALDCWEINENDFVFVYVDG